MESDFEILLNLFKSQRGPVSILQERLRSMLEETLAATWQNPYPIILERTPRAQAGIRDALTTAFQTNLLWHIGFLIVGDAEHEEQITLATELLVQGNPLVGEVRIPVGDEVEEAPLVITA